MKKNYKFSVIIPIFNPGKEFKQCINSIAKSIKFFSTKKSLLYEVLLINDGGREISLNFQKDLKNCKQIKFKKNRGVGFVRNFGAEKAKYENLFFIDSDLVIEKNFFLYYLEILINLKIQVQLDLYKIILI